jgi:esterase/lipase superfamily enzyme
MALGSAHVQYGEATPWDTIVNISGDGGKKTQISIHVENTIELERFPATPLLFTVTPKGPILDPEVAVKYGNSKTIFQNAVRQQLSKSPNKDVILYVHGFNNSFEDSVFSLNDIWHYTGRRGVPIVYSWPSGSGNLLGYFTDRESGEFTIYHLKETLRVLFEMDEIANIHIIAHSRGTDITTTALRELIIETRASGLNPRKALRIKNLILAAPDLDYDIVKQRLIAEKFGPAFGKITIYMNEHDGALGISQFLMRGVRFGRLIASKQGEHEDKIFKNVKNVTFINVKDVSGLIGHGYFTKHSGALSDIVRVLTTDSLPGSTERPLVHIQNNFWALDKNYLAPTN